MTHETSKAFVDYYQLLGVQPDAMNEDIRTAFVRLAKLQHPDTGGSLEDMQQLNLAYMTLKNPQTRRAYDMMHSFQTGTSELHYRDMPMSGHAAKPNAEDDEIDDFINEIFAEYAAKPSKKPFHKKAASALRFYRRKT
ncbi:DnaJ domain-containing protein [Candidatus Saccharibacteria bacterium]|nr:MAG: DnaJ domain-containing protein [Candidatus Saccharibacteria bacterium]